MISPDTVGIDSDGWCDLGNPYLVCRTDVSISAQLRRTRGAAGPRGLDVITLIQHNETLLLLVSI